MADAVVDGVVQRWNPAGMRLLRRVRGTDPGRRAVALWRPCELIGPTDPDELLNTELARLEPRIDIVASPLEAAVLVVVLDAGVVVGRSELTALDKLIATGARTVFTMTGVDAHRDWRAFRDRNADLLTRYQQDADLRIWPVSPRLATLSRRLPDCDSGLVYASSGVMGLHAAILAAFPTDPAAEAASYLERTTAAVIAQTADRIREEADSLRGEDPATTALRGERTLLTTQRDGGRAETTAALRTQLQLARVDLLYGVGMRVRAANLAVRTELDRADSGHLPRLPEWLCELTDRLTAEVDQDIHRRIAELAARVDGGGPRVDTIVRTPAPLVGAGPTTRRRSIEDRVMIVLGGAAGLSLGMTVTRTLEFVGPVNITAAPLSLLLGGGAAWWLTRSRTEIADRGHLRQWVSDALVNVKSQLDQRVVAAVVEAEALFVEHITGMSAARMVEVDRRITDIGNQIREASARRAGKLAACDRDLASLGNDGSG